MGSELADALEDVAFTIATPFTEDGEGVRLDALERNLAHLVDRGAALFVPCGNTGEYYSLSNEERVDTVEATVDAVGAEGTVLAGLGGSLPTSVDLAEQYADVGADGLMVMPPVHTHRHRRGLVRYYREIATATDLDVVVYTRGPTVGGDVLAELTTVDGIVGVKYAINDIKAFSAAVSSASDEVVWINGLAERFAPAFALEGATGFTTGIGNFAPEASLALHRALRSREFERAGRIRDAIRPFENLREEPGADNDIPAANNVPAVKFGMELAGLYGGPVRPPLVGLSEEDEPRARDGFETIRELP